MDLEHLEQKLLAAARAERPSDAVPYAFEQRIMAQVRALPKPDGFVAWGQALWRGAMACAAIALLSSLWTLLPLNSSDDLSQDLEHTVLASLDEVDNSAW